MGIVSLLFVILYGQAVVRMRRKKTLDFDFKDRILLWVALIESCWALIFHILFTHNVLLFILILSKMLEQVTICFILIELTFRAININRMFMISALICGISVFIVITAIFIRGSTDFLNEN
jgi:hypothetical protein